MDRKVPTFTTLGCRLNAYETEAMREMADAAGLWLPRWAGGTGTSS